MKQPAIYIMTNRRNGTLYTGATSDLVKRVWVHRQSVAPGLTAKYGCTLLVWYEVRETMVDAITREKQIKAGSRESKLRLVEASNPEWRDLYEDLL